VTNSPDQAVRVDVQTGDRASAIVIGEGIVDRLPALLDAHHAGARRFIVSSPVIWRFHGARIQRALGDGEPILIPDGERFKNLQSVSRI
jgi:3-dehydroquinate synthetase